VERCRSVRDRALALLLFYTALRIGECASLDSDDVALSARKGRVIVRAGTGDTYREVALNTEAREALVAWLTERRQRFPKPDEPALFLNPGGHRLSIRSIDLALRRLGEEADIAVSAHTLRHSCLTNLVRRGHDLVLVAEIAGHKRLETTRRYSLPTEGDRIAALGHQALQRLTGGPPAELRQKLQSVGVNHREIPSCRAWATQKVEFLQLSHDRLGSVRRRPVAEPRERCTAKRFFSDQEGIERQQPFVGKQRGQSVKRFSMAPLARGHDKPFEERYAGSDDLLSE
jgi:hypothetical protein